MRRDRRRGGMSGDLPLAFRAGERIYRSVDPVWSGPQWFSGGGAVNERPDTIGNPPVRGTRPPPAASRGSGRRRTTTGCTTTTLPSGPAPPPRRCAPSPPPPSCVAGVGWEPGHPQESDNEGDNRSSTHFQLRQKASQRFGSNLLILSTKFCFCMVFKLNFVSPLIGSN